MSQILSKVRDVDPNNSEAVKDILASFFQNLPKHTEIDCFKWLRTLEGIINRFPKYCMSHRTTAETYLSHFLNCNNYYNVIAAAKCAHALQQVRPSQEKTATAKSCWRDLMNLLCSSAHSLIGALFPHAVDIYKQSGKTQNEPQAASSPLSSALASISTVKAQSNTVNKHALLATRLKNVFVFLQAMLVEIYPVAKPVRPQTTLDVVMRALSVSSAASTAGQDPSDITMVKTQALRSLDALVVCLGSNLIPFSPLVFRFVMQTLKWSSDNPSDDSRKVRCAAYSSLGRWLTSLRSQSAAAAGRGRCWQDELTDHVINDITPHRHVVQLTMSNQPTKHLSKKAKRKMANTMLQESAIASHMPGEKNKIPIPQQMNDDVAIAALECAEIFLTVCGMFLKPATHKLFQERLVRECYNLAGYSSSRALRLLRALDAARRGAPPGAPPPTQYCLHVYSVMVNSAYREISNFCSQAMLEIRLHLHCSPPSLNFAIEVQPEEKKKQAGDKKRTSERNRAALEALLGTEKVPAQNEEVITIADEPSIKRRRVEDVSDKISVSSESEGSIEISDDSEDEDSIAQEVEVLIERVNTEENNELETQVDETDGNDVTGPNQTNVEITIEEQDHNDVVLVEEQDGNDVMRVEECNDDDGAETINKNKDKQLEEKRDSSALQESFNIYNAATQIPLNVSYETIDEEERPLSMEVAYDYPNTGKEKVTVLEKLEDENLPSTGDTDDIQITCGQVVKYFEEGDSEKKSVDLDPKVGENVPKINGVDNSPSQVVENGISDNNIDKDNRIEKVNNEGVSVEDMLADFVDEVNDDITQASVLPA